jgi:hypothetical protein
MKIAIILCLIATLLAITPCKAHTIDSGASTLMHPSPASIAHPADGQGKFVAGTISFFVGVGLLAGGSVVRYTSSKSKTMETGKGMQGLGITLIGLPLGFYVASNGRIKSSRPNRKPRGFKNRHHYY